VHGVLSPWGTWERTWSNGLLLVGVVLLHNKWDRYFVHYNAQI